MKKVKSSLSDANWFPAKSSHLLEQSDVWWGALTLLSMAPMMLGPWQCSRPSWLTGWWRMRFFTISRKAATLFLSSLPSERIKTTFEISCVTYSHVYILQSTLQTLSYSQDDSLVMCWGICLTSVRLLVRLAHLTNIRNYADWCAPGLLSSNSSINCYDSLCCLWHLTH